MGEMRGKELLGYLKGGTDNLGLKKKKFLAHQP